MHFTTIFGSKMRSHLAIKRTHQSNSQRVNKTTSLIFVHSVVEYGYDLPVNDQPSLNHLPNPVYSSATFQILRKTSFGMIQKPIASKLPSMRDLTKVLMISPSTKFHPTFYIYNAYAMANDSLTKLTKLKLAYSTFISAHSLIYFRKT